MFEGPVGCEGFDSILKEVDQGDFSIGQCYEKTPAKTLICKKCGANTFIVGIGSYFTAIKCKKCKWELCIHNG